MCPERRRAARSHPGRRIRGRQNGYVLLLVLASLALIAFVASRFAQRMETQREQAMSLRDAANARLAADSAKAIGMYWVAPRPLSADGFGDEARRNWRADGRWYKVGHGAVARLQDQFGLMSLNALDRPAFTRLLMAQGAAPGQADTLIDTLEDYTDLDSLRRLNGAETAEYQAAGLLGPRNDWLLSPRELCQMPTWHALPDLCDRVSSLVSTRRTAPINPNTAPPEVLRAVLPDSAPGQVERFLSLREKNALPNAQVASQVSGLPFQRDDSFAFHAGNTVYLTVWAPGLPRAVQYNLLLLTDNPLAPWLVTEVHAVERPSRDALSTNTLELPEYFETQGRAAK